MHWSCVYVYVSVYAYVYIVFVYWCLMVTVAQDGDGDGDGDDDEGVRVEVVVAGGGAGVDDYLSDGVTSQHNLHCARSVACCMLSDVVGVVVVGVAVDVIVLMVDGAGSDYVHHTEPPDRTFVEMGCVRRRLRYQFIDLVYEQQNVFTDITKHKT